VDGNGIDEKRVPQMVQIGVEIVSITSRLYLF